MNVPSHPESESVPSAASADEATTLTPSFLPFASHARFALSTFHPLPPSSLSVMQVTEGAEIMEVDNARKEIILHDRLYDTNS